MRLFYTISLIDNLTDSVFLSRINRSITNYPSSVKAVFECNCTEAEACTWTMEMVKGPFTSKPPYFGKVWRWSYLMTPSSDTISRICTTRPATRYAFLPINYLLVWNFFFSLLSLRVATLRMQKFKKIEKNFFKRGDKKIIHANIIIVLYNNVYKQYVSKIYRVKVKKERISSEMWLILGRRAIFQPENWSTGNI